MIEAIRNLGILKMIDEFEEFDFNALESVESFLGQREKAIESGAYAKLQFEPINVDQIGIFAMDDGKIKFQVERVLEDNWKYLFLKTASQGTYITPTWKESQNKLKKTVERLIKESKDKENVADWVQNVVKIYTSEEIEIGELDKEGKLEKKPFFGTVDWAKKTKKINVFSVRINGKYNAGIKELLDLALRNKQKIIYQTDTVKSINSSGIKCSLCHTETELFPNVLAGVGINIANVDKPGFFPGVATENAGKAFPICAPCAEALYAAKFHVFSNLRQNISGHQALIIPHLVESEDKEDGLDIVTSALRLLRRDLSGAEQKEAGILKDLAENKGIATITFLIGDVGGQSVENIRKVIPDVLPSRLSEISDAINEINTVHDTYPDIYVKSKTVRHPWQSKNQPPLTGNLGIIRKVLGSPKHLKQKSGGKRPPFKASRVNTLDLLSSIFLKRDYPSKALLAEFSAKLSYDFLGALSDDDKNKPIYSIRDNIANMVHLLLFLEKLGVIKMELGENFVSKYLDKHKGLKPLNDFLREEARGLNTEEKQYAFLVGLLFGKLVNIQLAKQVSANALKWLKGLQISPQDLMDIFVKTKSKLDDYSTPKTAWSEEMRGVAEAIGALGADIKGWDISRKEIPYYLCLGQSLSGYYLPSKGMDKTEEQKEDEKYE
jgi:CRISPR-associated Csh1 family protein